MLIYIINKLLARFGQHILGTAISHRPKCLRIIETCFESKEVHLPEHNITWALHLYVGCIPNTTLKPLQSRFTVWLSKRLFSIWAPTRKLGLACSRQKLYVQNINIDSSIQVQQISFLGLNKLDSKLQCNGFSREWSSSKKFLTTKIQPTRKGIQGRLTHETIDDKTVFKDATIIRRSSVPRSRNHAATPPISQRFFDAA